MLRWTGFACVFVAIMFAPSVFAQGTQGQLPDPISAARLSAYADMLDLSPQQRHALNDLHAPYREEFQKLRESEIEAWLLTVRSGPIGRAYIAKQRDLLARIAALDERFFDSAMEVLAEPQVAALQRVRSLRKRERIMSIESFWWWWDAQPFDLSEAVRGAMLLPEQREAIDGMLAAYEFSLTAKLEDVEDGHFAWYAKLFDAYARAGLTDERLADETEIDAILAVSRSITSAEKPLRHARVKAIVDLHQKTVAAIAPMLSADVNRTLQRKFIAASYSEERFFRDIEMIAGHIQSPFADALRRDDLTGEQRTSLEAQSQAFEKAIDETLEVLVAHVDAYRSWNVESNDREEEFKRRNEIEAAGRQAWESLRKRQSEEGKQVAALIGPEPSSDVLTDDPETADLAKIGVFSVLFPRSDVSWVCPPRINRRDLDTYRRWLMLDADRFAMLQNAYARYAADCDSLIDAHRESIRSASRALHAGDSIEGYTRENLQRHRAANAAAERAQRDVERRFFAAIEEELGLKENDVVMARVRCARERAWAGAFGYNSRFNQPSGRHDGMFDVANLVLRMRGIDVAAPAVDAILIEHEQVILPLLQARHTAVTRFAELSDDLRVEWQELRRKTSEKFPDMRARNAEAGEPERLMDVKRAAEPIAELNQATVERLIAALPADQSSRVRYTFDRMAWPNIHTDGSSAASLLQSALIRDDLSSDQRSQVQDLAASYFPEYDEMIAKMKVSVETADSPVYDDNVQQRPNWEEQMAAFWVRNGERKRMLFDRHELNVRVWQRLKRILTEDQAKAIGMSVTPPEGPSEHDDFGS